MVGELAMYLAPKGLSRDEMVKVIPAVVHKWQAMPRLTQKYLSWSYDRKNFYGFCRWENREGAEVGRNAYCHNLVGKCTGELPKVSYFSATLLADSETSAIQGCDAAGEREPV